MQMLTLVLLVVGSLAALGGSILLLIAAFRQNVWWGLASLFLPFASLIFVILHWARARTGFLLSLAGTLLVVGGVLSSPVTREMMTHANTFDLAKLKSQLQPPVATPAPTLDAQIEGTRQKIEQLEARFAQDGTALLKQFRDLSGRRTALKTGDAPALTAFNTEAADYQARNTARKQARVDIDTLKHDLEGLLDQRSRQNAVQAKHVVIYSTSSCPACKMAKSYFAEKGIPYEEHDVEKSPEAQAEFQRLGGHGVPLILVGAEKMEGFNSQRLDQLL